MKRIGLSIVFFFPLFFSIGFGQSYKLSSIDVRFCNNQEITKELDLIGKAGDEVSLCVNFSNTSKQGIGLNIDFLDANITQDNFQNRSCNAADRPKEQFGNFMLPYEKNIYLSGQSSLQKIYKIKLPVGFKGLSHGCLAYNELSKDNKQKGGFVNIVVRKVQFIDIFVGETEIKSQIKIGSIETTKDGKITNLKIGVKNIGNIDQNITISGYISNIFGFHKPLMLNQNKFDLAANNDTIITTNNSDLILPPYKGLFEVTFTINNKPSFNFNIQPADKERIPQKAILGGTFTISKNIFIFSPYATGIICVFLILIYLAFFRKRKTILISQANPRTATGTTMPTQEQIPTNTNNPTNNN